MKKLKEIRRGRGCPHDVLESLSTRRKRIICGARPRIRSLQCIQTAAVGKGVKANCMLYMNGISESYRLKRVAEVFNSIFNEENPMVCVHVRLDIQKERIRGVEVGDVVGRLYSVVDEIKDLDGNMVLC